MHHFPYSVGSSLLWPQQTVHSGNKNEEQVPDGTWTLILFYTDPGSLVTEVDVYIYPNLSSQMGYHKVNFLYVSILSISSK